MKALAFVRRDSNAAISIIRTLWPFRELSQHGHTCRFVDAQSMPEIVRMGQQETDEKIGGFDLYVFSRVLGPSKECPLQDYKDKGAKVVLEVDDDITDETRVWGMAPYLDDVASWADAITTSTETLSQIMEKRYGKPTYTLPNFIDTEYFQRISMKADRVFPELTIGLVGTGSHWFDWIELVEPLTRIGKDYPQVKILVAGCYPEYMRSVPTVQFIAGLPFDEYPALLRQVDIRVIALEKDDRFNLCKSPIAAMEAMAATRNIGKKLGGAVPVCADHPVYRDLIRQDTGILVQEGGWYEALARLIEDEAYRASLAQTGREWVQANCDISYGYKLWEAAYSHILGGKKRGNKLSSAGRSNVVTGQFNRAHKKRNWKRRPQ